MPEAMAYVEVPGYGTLIPISEVERVVNERDRLRTALEMIADDERPWHTCEHTDHAREALDG